MNISALRLNQRGLARLFGDLEAKVMEAVWSLEAPTVHDVVKRLGKRTNYKTIMTVMNRLVDKGFLERRKVSRSFIYVPRQSRDALLEKMSRQILDSLLADFGPVVLAQFVEAVEETDRDRLADLGKLVERRLATRRKRRG